MANSVENRIMQGASALFSKFLVSVSKVEPAVAAVVMLAATGSVFGVGAFQEIAHQTAILSSAGPEALKAYRESTPDSLMAFMGHALAGDMPSPAFQLQGVGAWMSVTLPPVAYALTKLVKGFDFVREAGERAERAQRPRGATRLNQLNEGLASLGNSLPIASEEQAERSKTNHGPGMR